MQTICGRCIPLQRPAAARTCCGRLGLSCCSLLPCHLAYCVQLCHGWQSCSSSPYCAVSPCHYWCMAAASCRRLPLLLCQLQRSSGREIQLLAGRLPVCGHWWPVPDLQEACQMLHGSCSAEAPGGSTMNCTCHRSQLLCTKSTTAPACCHSSQGCLPVPMIVANCGLLVCCQVWPQASLTLSRRSEPASSIRRVSASEHHFQIPRRAARCQAEQLFHRRVSFWTHLTRPRSVC